MIGVPLKLGLRRQLLKRGIHVGRYLQDLMAIRLRVCSSRYRDRFQEGGGMRKAHGRHVVDEEMRNGNRVEGRSRPRQEFLMVLTIECFLGLGLFNSC